jgi:hypothetical protein
MLRTLADRYLKRYKGLIYAEAETMKGFMALLMKTRNTGQPWSKEEIRELKGYFRHLAQYIPILIIILMPFGSLFLPLLAEALDRRRNRRPPVPG